MRKTQQYDYDPCAKLVLHKPQAEIQRLGDIFSVVAEQKVWSDGRKSSLILGENIPEIHLAAQLRMKYNRLHNYD